MPHTVYDLMVVAHSVSLLAQHRHIILPGATAKIKLSNMLNQCNSHSTQQGGSLENVVVSCQVPEGLPHELASGLSMRASTLQVGARNSRLRY
jgi:hypothetical protein